MVVPRTAAFRTLFAAPSRRIAGSRVPSQVWRQVSRRGYSSEGSHGHAKPSSDIPWLIGSIAITVPSAYYLLQPSESDGHGHGAHDEKHDEKHEEPAEVKEEKQPEPEPEPETKSAEEPKEETAASKEGEAEAEAEEAKTDAETPKEEPAKEEPATETPAAPKSEEKTESA